MKWDELTKLIAFKLDEWGLKQSGWLLRKKGYSVSFFVGFAIKDFISKEASPLTLKEIFAEEEKQKQDEKFIGHQTYNMAVTSSQR